MDDATPMGSIQLDDHLFLPVFVYYCDQHAEQGMGSRLKARVIQNLRKRLNFGREEFWEFFISRPCRHLPTELEIQVTCLQAMSSIAGGPAGSGDTKTPLHTALRPMEEELPVSLEPRESLANKIREAGDRWSWSWILLMEPPPPPQKKRLHGFEGPLWEYDL